MNMTPLMDFRTTYLRAIALSWIDPDFYEGLVGSADPIPLLENTFQFKWPWPGELKLKIKRSEELQWIGDRWIWPPQMGDTLTLHVPLSSRTSERESASALAAYYRARPSLLDLDSAAVAASIKALGVNTFYSTPLIRFSSSGLPQANPGDGTLSSGNDIQGHGFVPSTNGFLDFQVALISVMGAAWTNKNFYNAVQKHPIAMLYTVHHYRMPWKMTIKIVDDQNAHYVSADGGGVKEGEWKDLAPHMLELCFPSAPEQVREQPVALAAYNSTGADYPFTCCF